MILLPAELAQEVSDELRTHYLRIKPLAAAERLWQRALRARDRQKLGGDMVKAFAKLGTIGMWQKVHGGSRARAIVEVARAIGTLDGTTHDWLFREIGERAGRRENITDRPTWDRETGQLCFRGEIIRNVRVMAAPSNIQRILDDFQRAKWKRTMRSPLPREQQRLHQALRSLNKNLDKIRFHSAKGAQFIRREVV